MGSERENFYCLWVTQCLNEQCPFLCLMWRKFWASKSWKNSSIVFIVLIVLIVAQCLNDAMSFSLFNATQFLSIEIRGNPDVVFIVLIVFIVTWYLNEAMPFLLLLWCRFCTLKNKKQTKHLWWLLAVIIHAWSFLLSKIYQFHCAEHTWLFETFKRLITPIEMWWMKTQHIKQGDFRRVSNSANPLCAALLIRLLYKSCLYLSIVIYCVSISHIEN